MKLWLRQAIRKSRAILLEGEYQSSWGWVYYVLCVESQIRIVFEKLCQTTTGKERYLENSHGLPSDNRIPSLPELPLGNRSSHSSQRASSVLMSVSYRSPIIGHGQRPGCAFLFSTTRRRLLKYYIIFIIGNPFATQVSLITVGRWMK